MQEAEHVYKQCAFKLFKETVFPEAFQLLRKIKLDPVSVCALIRFIRNDQRLVIILFPSVCPKACKPEISSDLIPFYNDVVDLDHVIEESMKNYDAQNNTIRENLELNALHMLKEYLETFRESSGMHTPLLARVFFFSLKQG